MHDVFWVMFLNSPTLSIILSQFALWVDAVIFVFSLEDEISFQTVYHYYSRMANYRNTAEVPLVLVGTQGKCRHKPCIYHMTTAVFFSGLATNSENTVWLDRVSLNISGVFDQFFITMIITNTTDVGKHCL